MTVLIDVSASPLNILVQLYPAGTNASATQNSQYVQTTASLLSALPLLQGSLSQAFNPILPFLQTPMGVLFNTAWAGQQTTVENYAASQFQAQADTNGISVSNVTCSLPASGGTVLAAAYSTAPGSAEDLIIDFHLPGGEIKFHTQQTVSFIVTETVTLAVRITFDADLSMSTPVPVQPFNLTPSAQVTLSNASVKPDDGLTSFLEALDNLVTGLGNFFLQRNWISTADWDTQLMQERLDETQTLPTSVAGSMLSLFTVLNKARPECVAYGFTECAFSIVGSTLTLTVTHPLDPGPTILDANNPTGDPDLLATLATTAPDATPGGTITALGTGFPRNTSDVLNLEFLNTASGTPTGAQVQHDGQIHAVPLPPNPNPNANLNYNYTPAGLSPGTTYSFQARCQDQITWSQWGPTFELATAASANVELVLAQFGTAILDVPIGDAPLSPANSTWTCQGAIPLNTSVGKYELQAWLGGVPNGTMIAQMPFNIVATATAQIAIIDPVTKAVSTVNAFSGPGIPFTLAGWGFPDGTVTISIDGTPVTTATAIGGNFTAPLKTPQFSVSGTVNVTATGGNVTAAPVPIDLERIQ